MAPGGGKGGGGRGKRRRGGGAGAGGRGPPPGPPARTQPRDWAGLPRELLENVGRAVPAGGRLLFRLVCRRWAAAGAEVAQAAGERELRQGKVTRTRGANGAASVARAEMVRRVLEGQVLKDFERRICEYAAGCGYLSVLKWARAKGCPWNIWTCPKAAENGHLAVLQWARAQGCPLNSWTCAYAAMNGHFAVLQWARAQGCRWDKNKCARAAKDAMEWKPHIDYPPGNANDARNALLKWIYSQDSESESYSDSDDSIGWNKTWSIWDGWNNSESYSESDDWSDSDAYGVSDSGIDRVLGF